MIHGEGGTGTRSRAKLLLVRVLAGMGADHLCRFLNRGKLLVLMYHGVSARDYHPPFWTQLPVATFRDQMAFVRKHYNVITLEELLTAVRMGQGLPERSALITFDDGFKNNLNTAFPVLQEFGLPASIFLTTSFIGTGKLLWVDELFLLIQEGARLNVPLPLRGLGAMEQYRAGELWEAYQSCVEAVKRVGAHVREPFLQELRRLVPLDHERWLADIGPLNWQDVRFMEQSGLISFGVHTAHHRILTELNLEELAQEVAAPRWEFAMELGREPASFCFPNGRPGVDFNALHQEFLRKCGYQIAFTTVNELFDLRGGDLLGISRIAVGNDGTSEPGMFRLSTSGAFHSLVAARNWIFRRKCVTQTVRFGQFFRRRKMRDKSAFHIETVHDATEFARLKPEWDALHEALAEGTSVFMSHSWCQCWWRHFGGKAALNLVLVRRGGELVGIFPLMRVSTSVHGLPVHSLSFMENWNSLHNDPLVRPECRDEVLHAVLKLLYAECWNWDLLQLNNIPADSEICTRLTALLTEEGRSFQLRPSVDSPYLEVTGDWQGFLSSRSTRVRKTLRNIQNGMERSGEWQVFQVTTWEEYLLVREGILLVARNSWTKRIGDSLADPLNASFFDDLARAASAEGWLSIWVLRLGGKEIAFEFHLRGCHKQHALRASYHEEFSGISPGAFLEMQALKSVFEEPLGVRRFDFGGSFDPYKKRWSEQSRTLISLQVFNQRFYSRLAALHETGLVPVVRGVRDRLRSRHERSESGSGS